MRAVKLVLLTCLAMAFLHTTDAAGDSFWGASCTGIGDLKSCGPLSICDSSLGNALTNTFGESKRSKRGFRDTLKSIVDNTSGQCRPSPTFWILLVLGILAVIAATCCACICLPACILYKSCGALRGGE